MIRRTTVLALAILLVTFFACGIANAQIPVMHIINANGTGRVTARPDLGILIMEIETSAPLAADAASQCAAKATSVRSALSALGYAPDSVELTPIVFTRAGGTNYGPNQPSLTGFSAQQYVFVFFGAEVLANPAELDRKVAAAIDTVTKAGASPANPYPQPQAAMVVYTLKDASADESQALQKALEQARASAQATAKQMGVEITGLRNISTGYAANYGGGMAGAIGPYAQVPTNPLQDLPYRFYSTRSDEVVITASASLVYDFK